MNKVECTIEKVKNIHI